MIYKRSLKKNKLYKKIKIIEKILNFLYPYPKINLYYINEYTLLISIILTSRSKEKKVNEVTKKIFNKIKSPYDIVSLSLKEIKNLIKEIGLYNKKANNIFNLSKILIDKFNCIIPKNISILKKLPGIGNKTASVFLSHISITNKYEVFPVDTHIHRMMYRWRLSNGKNINETEKNVKIFFEKKKWKKLHLQIILYGREFSPYNKLNIKKDIIHQELLNNSLL
ncbi:endonuclease III domain-containing protein [Blattabacterium cuenoti]|uniref:endonuclease III domain-containing protein n=1 Tax=Blattabacterium cuenoti TaxID=1653831 RepID=UPI00163BC84D|nr:endonuclease III [Blattabacterium cuenoti]